MVASASRGVSSLVVQHLVPHHHDIHHTRNSPRLPSGQHLPESRKGLWLEGWADLRFDTKEQSENELVGFLALPGDSHNSEEQNSLQ